MIARPGTHVRLRGRLQRADGLVAPAGSPGVVLCARCRWRVVRLQLPYADITRADFTASAGRFTPVDPRQLDLFGGRK